MSMFDSKLHTFVRELEVSDVLRKLMLECVDNAFDRAEAVGKKSGQAPGRYFGINQLIRSLKDLQYSQGFAEERGQIQAAISFISSAKYAPTKDARVKLAKVKEERVSSGTDPRKFRKFLKEVHGLTFKGRVVLETMVSEALDAGLTNEKLEEGYKEWLS